MDGFSLLSFLNGVRKTVCCCSCSDRGRTPSMPRSNDDDGYDEE
jgi:hypothetical protein